MEASTASPRGRSIRETVLESVAAYHHQQRMRRRFRKSLSSASAVSLSAGPEDDDEPFWEEEEGTVELVQLGPNRAKNVLILMSDTGGGHHASTEAIKDAYRVFVKDLCKDHAGWPLNNIENSYKFMVKHV